MTQLSDIERKVKTIIINMNRYGKTITIEDLCVKTGRDKEALVPVLKSLIDKRIIKGVKDGKIII